MTRTVTATAHPNIALVKYWGKRDIPLNLPAVPSLSLTLDGFATNTQLTWGTVADEVWLNDQPAPAKFTSKVLKFLSLMVPDRPPVVVRTWNNFPTGAGLASSASGFAALALATASAAELDLSMEQLSAFARQGSGSASRSLWGGYVRWNMGEQLDGSDSHGEQVADESHWDLRMVVGVVSEEKKAVGSTEGMERSRLTSALYRTWVDQAAADVVVGTQAVLDRDLEALGRVMESSTFKMHATMHTSQPPLQYWAPGSVACQRAIWELRERRGVSAWVTMDAGPQVKVLCKPDDAEEVALAMAPHTQATHILGPGGPAVVREG